MTLSDGKGTHTFFPIVLVREENILSPITALRDMVRHAGENGSRKPGHLGRLP